MIITKITNNAIAEQRSSFTNLYSHSSIYNPYIKKQSFYNEWHKIET